MNFEILIEAEPNIHGFSALGQYDNCTDTILLFLERITARCLLDFYHCIPEPPEPYRHPEAFENYLGDKIGLIFTHECIHRALDKTVNEQASIAYDDLSYDILESEG